MAKYLSLLRSKRVATAFPLNVTFARTLVNSLSCIKWSVYRKCQSLTLDLIAWMWSWKRGLPSSKKTWQTTRLFSINSIRHSARYVIGTAIPLTRELCWKSVIYLRQISTLMKTVNLKSRKNWPCRTISTIILAFIILANPIS